MMQGLTECAHCSHIAIADALHIIYTCSILSHFSIGMLLHCHERRGLRSFFASQNQVQISSLYRHVLNFKKYEFYFLSYVMRFAGWLKRCALSLFQACHNFSRYPFARQAFLIVVVLIVGLLCSLVKTYVYF